ncbi:unnamed protein product [Hyaloperonospora brassicae]|uniref:HTH psq-type domain-containing protein n=1 Tax=Hyaloperonospora brassicae TaxID=162125 RepID=A0AAV0TAF0_HYABA|nr:unnamed protein product [Hyaloperonospora brassicae]
MASQLLPPSCESVMDSTDYHMPLYSPRHQPLLYSDHQYNPLLPTGIPPRGHAPKLPGVATLLRRHDTAQAIHAASPSAVPPMNYDLQRSRIETKDSCVPSECWTPPHLVGRAQSITSPAFKWVPLTASLNPLIYDHPMDDRTCQSDKFVSTPTLPLTTTTAATRTSTEKSHVNDMDALLLSSDIRSPEPARPYRDLQPKSSRYLREIDRRRILLRIAQGEKQSALAKEYHVSRAAICNLNKHRAEVLSRKYEHPLAKHPKRRMATKVQVRDTGDDSQWRDASSR